MKESPPAVLLGLSYSSLPVARSLGRRGVPVFGIDKDRSQIGARSRYVRLLDSPTDHQDLLNLLVAFAHSHGSKAVLFPFDDDHLVFLSRNRAKLSRYFSFPYPNEWSLEQLVSKESMATILEKIGVAIPHTITLREASIADLESLQLAFPIVLKPDFHTQWLSHPDVRSITGGRKAILVEDLPSLKKYYGLLAKYETLVAQEFIAGETSSQYYFVGYRNSSGQILVSFVGRKLRTFPDTVGSECLLQSVRHPYLCELGEGILERMNYVGPAGLDFKFDARDQSYKLIEMNCRLGISDGLLVTCGVDVPYIYYTDVQGMNSQRTVGYEEKIYWWWFEKDLQWFREYKNRDGLRRLRSWTHVLSNKCSYAVYAGDDLGPMVHVVTSLAARTVKNLVGRWGAWLRRLLARGGGGKARLRD